MIKKLSSMPASLIVIAVWVAVWIYVSTTNSAPKLCGKGISNIGGEFYRFLTAGLTHTSVIHLLVNVSAMFWVGYLYEQRLGSTRFLLISILCAVITQVVFLTIYRNADGSVGGSIVNFALCGFGLAMQFLIPDYPKIQLGTWSGNWLTIYLVVSNIPVLSFMSGSTIVIHAIAFGIGIIAAGLSWLIGIRL